VLNAGRNMHQVRGQTDERLSERRALSLDGSDNRPFRLAQYNLSILPSPVSPYEQLFFDLGTRVDIRCAASRHKLAAHMLREEHAYTVMVLCMVAAFETTEKSLSSWGECAVNFRLDDISSSSRSSKSRVPLASANSVHVFSYTGSYICR
jgi:hypothetical protein